MRLAVTCAAVLAVALLIGAMTTALAPSEASADAANCNRQACWDQNPACASWLCCVYNPELCYDPPYSYHRAWVSYDDEGCTVECSNYVSCAYWCGLN